MWPWNKPEPSTEAEFDIEGLDVFSIERDEVGGTLFGFTQVVDRVVGEKLYDGTIINKVVSLHQSEEWYITTTDEQHRAFVARLTAKLATKNNSEKVREIA